MTEGSSAFGVRKGFDPPLRSIIDLLKSAAARPLADVDQLLLGVVPCRVDLDCAQQGLTIQIAPDPLKHGIGVETRGQC